MLCPTCQECCRDVLLDGGRTDDLAYKGRPHHLRLSDLERSVADGCQICLVLWEHRTNKLGMDGRNELSQETSAAITYYHSSGNPNDLGGPICFTHLDPKIPWASFNLLEAPSRLLSVLVQHHRSDQIWLPRHVGREPGAGARRLDQGIFHSPV